MPTRVKAVAGTIDRALDVAGKGVLPDLITITITGSADRVVTVADGTAAEHGVRFTTGSEGRFYAALPLAAELFEQGKFELPTTLEVPMTEAAEAHRYREQGHVRGKVIVRIAD